MSSDEVEGLILQRLRRAYAATTDGQRWTAALALVIFVAFELFGLRTTPASNALSIDAAELPSPSSATAADVATPSPPPLNIAPAPATAFPAATPSPTAGSSSGGAQGSATPVPSPPTVVALTRAGGALPGQHDDQTIAGVFLPQVGVPVKVITLDPSRSDMCAAVLAAGHIVVAGEGLPRSLRDCLVQRGAVVLSHDQLGSSGRSVSSRLGATPAIVDAVVTGQAKGKIGIAAVASVEPEAKAAAALLKARGTDTLVTVVPDGGVNAGDIADGIRSFASAGVDTVVFAMPVGDQSTWVAVEGLFGFRPGHVVADVADAFVNESYPPLLDGVAAVAATRVPWFARTHGETAEQKTCRTTFETAVGSPASGSQELAAVFMWCEHATLLRRAVAAGGAVDDALRKLTLPSPLTSTLSAEIDGVFAPQEVAVLAWHASCGCWSETTPYRHRTGTKS